MRARRWRTLRAPHIYTYIYINFRGGQRVSRGGLPPVETLADIYNTHVFLIIWARKVVVFKLNIYLYIYIYEHAGGCLNTHVFLIIWTRKVVVLKLNIYL